MVYKKTLLSNKNSMTYSTDLINCILRIKKEDKLSYRETAKKFGVSAQSIFNWEKGILPTRKRVCDPYKIPISELEQDVIDRPDDFQYERAERFGVNRRSIGYALKRQKITRKKSPMCTRKQTKQHEKNIN